MQRGELWLAESDPPIMGVRRQRPVIIVSNNSANQHLNRVLVVPVSSTEGKSYPSEAAIQFDGIPHKALADQLTTVSKQRLKKKLGEVAADDMEMVDYVLKLHLDLL